MRTRYRNVAFLAELMINILVFSISCAVLVGLFGKAYQVSRQTQMETDAATEVQWLMENLKAGGPGALEYAQSEADGSLLCYYDQNWNPVAPPFETRDTVRYTIRLVVTAGEEGARHGALTCIEAVATDAAGATLCQMETASYTPNFEGQP